MSRAGLLLALAATLGCAARAVPAPPEGRTLRFPEDVFAFANETVWEYDVDAATGSIAWRRREPPPPFALRCGPMVRAARQFWANARFDAGTPAADAATYERLVRAVLDGPRRERAAAPVVIPGYPDLRSFSTAHGPLLMSALAGVWQSHLQRGNWRMIFPFTGGHQQRLADRLRRLLAAGWPPIVHVLRYPALTLNHFVLVYAADESPAEVWFTAYDPNEPAHPVTLTYDRAGRMFSYSTTPYFPGGPVRAYDVYDGLLY